MPRGRAFNDPTDTRYVTDDHAWRAQWQAVKLIEPCRRVARQHGYALAEHGSKTRDIDWIAVPWIDDCASPRTLAEALVAEIGERNGGGNYCTPFLPAADLPKSWTPERIERGRNGYGDKPHGRLTWTIHLGGGPYIDLSVIPPSVKVPDHGP